MMDLANKKILLTGASRGLGAAVGLQLVEQGATVYGASRDPSRVAWPKGVIPVALDLSTPESVKVSWDASILPTVDIDILINNAGAGAFGSIQSTNPKLWDEQISLLLNAPIALCHCVLSKMIARQAGIILNVSSLACEYPIPYMSGYNAAKSALSSFTQTLMTEVGDSGIAAIDFRPGDFDSDFNDGMAKGGFPSEAVSKGARVWAVMVDRMASSPKPEAIAKDLVKALVRGRSGIVRSGSFFQRVLAPLYTRIAPSSWQRAANERYYKLIN